MWHSNGNRTLSINDISIHTPHTRCDNLHIVSYYPCKFISIHTPHTRCDLLGCLNGLYTLIYFNPHTSYEVWPKKLFGVDIDCIISIHTPHTRCDYWLLAGWLQGITFQSTHLIRGVTRISTPHYSNLRHFNPHTSYEVWRPSVIATALYPQRFQSTHLIRGVTFLIITNKGWVGTISIHTPHTRCDY